MAARQDQTQQIALIACGVLIFVLGIGLYFAYSSYQKEAAAVADLTQRRDTSDKAAREATLQAVDLKQMLGFAGEANFSDVTEQFEADKKRLMGTFAETNRNYRAVIDTLAEENRKIALQETEAKTRAKDLKDRLVAMEKEKDAEILKHKQELDKAKADLAAEQSNYEIERARINAETKRLATRVKELQSETEKAIAAAQTAKGVAEDELDKTKRANEVLLSERAVDNPSFEVADGRVTFVNQATGAAWINLGSADSLQRQVTFSVFESDLTDAGKADKKGSVEVVRILGDHLAEARITSDDPTNPVLPGDQVYSQVWQRGKQRRFALTGLIDLDGDGRSDLQQAKDLIALNGGVLDASLEDDGTVDGEITINTRYLVLGDYPEQASKGSIRSGFDTMSKEAALRGVETMSLIDFMSQMGYEPTEGTFRFGGGSGAKTGGETGSSGGYYRFRMP
ncbi:hypothetical protein [Botrimarina hoheduenensis]|uniref:Uncharacterized protein n=1 Tax=Botrimarina hoheduenensis TaxID=2528000 RepID=A0A5C5WGA3_9BACT|nr:hypothetical protein [Botrimarina hoheduenensis]TWT48812.1 hypothetical protein Pla111_05870 [Botrimarina hoheduenensis]